MRDVDRSVLAMAQEVAKLKALLDDPRLIVTGDSSTGADKAHADVSFAVRVLYESESRQLNALNGFVETGRRIDLDDDDENSVMMKSALKNAGSPVRGSGAGHGAYLGGPPGYANKLAEAHEFDRWMSRVITITTQREETASKVIVAAAALCR